jgi:uncharacterized protein (UPF0210 family)
MYRCQDESMKIRTITAGFHLGLPLDEERVRHIARFANSAKKEFEQNGYAVQTVRMATQPWEEYYTSKAQIVALVKELEAYAKTYAVDYYNVGPTKNPRLIPLVYDLISNTSKLFCTVPIADNRRIDYEATRQTAALIKGLSTISPDGFSNLRFAGLCNSGPGGAFFPAAYHRGPDSFAIGTENSDLVLKAFSHVRDIQMAGRILKEILMEEFTRIEEIAIQIGKKQGMHYEGIDVSIAPSVKPDESVAFAFEHLGLGRFGDAGTLTIAKIITDTIRDLEVRKCGYSGLMLPVLEDYGLAMRNIDGTFNITDLLLYSSVCGTGLDTIPLPGDVSEEKLYALLLDIASLSNKLDKPLSARLMPVPHKKVGEMTDYNFEYFANTKIMNI